MLLIAIHFCPGASRQFISGSRTRVDAETDNEHFDGKTTE